MNGVPREPDLKTAEYTREVPDADLSSEQLFMLYRNLVRGDQVFQNQMHGLFNAGLYTRLMQQHPQKFDRTNVPVTPQIVEFFASFTQLDMHLLRTMSDARLNEPVYFVTMDDEAPHLLIDGHHRLVARAMRGIWWVPAFVADEEMTALVHVVDFKKTGFAAGIPPDEHVQMEMTRRRMEGDEATTSGRISALDPATSNRPQP